jgi:hypothetical protein
LVPCTRRFLEAIECTVEAAHMVGTSGVGEASGLMIEDGLVESPTEKGVLEIKLTNSPVGRESD